MKWKQLLTKVTGIFGKKEEPQEMEESSSEDDKEIKALIKSDEKKGVHLRGQRVFDGEQQIFIVKLLAQGFTKTEIKEELKSKYGIVVTDPAIRNYAESDKWKPVVKKLRDEYVSSTLEVAGSHKRVRLERAERMYDRAIEKKDLKYGLQAIEQQRKEFDKHEYNSFNILNQQYNYMSDEEVEERKNLILSKLNKQKELKNGNGGIQGEAGKQG